MKNVKKCLMAAVILTQLANSSFAQEAEQRRVGGSVEVSEGSTAASDAAWQKALPIIERDAKNGKPFIPWAATPKDLPQADILAFPGAEGGGAYSFGGRGGRVFVVKTLADSGRGSFREACEQGGARIIVFNVAGIIKLESPVIIRAPYITIAGNTAPGDGVCITNESVWVNTHDVVIRHMRFRRGTTDRNRRDDAIGGHPVGNIMIDHVSAGWGLDENMSMYRHMYDPEDGSKVLKLPTVNITIQNSIFSETLNTYNHAFGSTIGGFNSMFARNLWACNTARNPSCGMFGDFNLVNNVMFNWKHRSVDGGDYRSYFNIINNYFKPGPATPKDQPVAHRFLKPESGRSKLKYKVYGRAHVSGNILVGNEKITKDNWAGGVQVEDRADAGEYTDLIRSLKPFAMAPVTITSAEEAYTKVLAEVGATLPKRDAVDLRILEQVKTGKVMYKDGIITDISQVGGFPSYSGKPYTDSDDDGMPDDWEKKHNLDPNDGSDAVKDRDNDGYTNIEEFINSNAKP